jgi:hypothetical protein
MIRAARFCPLIIAVAASALLVAGPANAEGTKPPIGSAACDQLVAADPGVVAANQGSAGGLPAAKAKAEGELCESATPDTSSTAPTTTPTSASEPPTSSSPEPSQSGRPSGGSGGSTSEKPPNRPGRPAGDRDCADFATQTDAQRYFESIGGSRTNNADRLDENHNGVACESLADDGDDQDATATATGDDGSEATTSGNQVTDVPEGSAQTGGQ